MTDKHPKRPSDPNQLVAGAVTLRLRNWDTALGTFCARAASIHPHWVIPMLGGGPDGQHPPCPRRVSELERPQCNCPALGPVLFGRPSPLLVRRHPNVRVISRVSVSLIMCTGGVRM